MQFHGPEKVTVFNLQTSCSFLVLYVNTSTGTLLRQLRHQLQCVEATDACSKEIDVKQSREYIVQLLGQLTQLGECIIPVDV